MSKYLIIAAIVWFAPVLYIYAKAYRSNISKELKRTLYLGAPLLGPFALLQSMGPERGLSFSFCLGPTWRSFRFIRVKQSFKLEFGNMSLLVGLNDTDFIFSKSISSACEDIVAISRELQEKISENSLLKSQLEKTASFSSIPIKKTKIDKSQVN